MKEDTLLKKIQRNVSLKKYNTMRLECMVSTFLKAESKEDVVRALEYAKVSDTPFLIIGNGSNIIFPSLYEGFVIYMGMSDYKIEEKEECLGLYVEAGAILPLIARKVTEKGASGMEWAGGIPGTIGGAIRGNAGAFGDGISDNVKEVRALDIETLEEKIFTKEECLFEYRDSLFKKSSRYVILSMKAEFPYKKDDDDKIEDFLKYRRENHPHNPSAGSVFKNPEVDDSFYLKHPEMERFKEMGFVPARVLIKDCGLSGREIGGAKISEKHPNFIINKGGATGDDVVNLINLIKKEVKNNFSIEMEEEVVIVK